MCVRVHVHVCVSVCVCACACVEVLLTIIKLTVSLMLAILPGTPIQYVLDMVHIFKSDAVILNAFPNWKSSSENRKASSEN